MRFLVIIVVAAGFAQEVLSQSAPGTDPRPTPTPQPQGTNPQGTNPQGTTPQGTTPPPANQQPRGTGPSQGAPNYPSSLYQLNGVDRTLNLNRDQVNQLNKLTETTQNQY